MLEADAGGLLLALFEGDFEQLVELGRAQAGGGVPALGGAEGVVAARDRLGAAREAGDAALVDVGEGAGVRDGGLVEEGRRNGSARL